MNTKYLIDMSDEDPEFYDNEFEDESILWDILNNGEDVQDDTTFCNEDFDDDAIIVAALQKYPYDRNHHQPLQIVDATSKLMNISFTKSKSGNYHMKSQHNICSEAYYYEPHVLFDGQYFEQFLSACKRVFRSSLGYIHYIDYVRNSLGIKTDAFNSHITQDKAVLELHHGPIFSLDDIIRIMIDYSFDKGLCVSSFTIAKLVLDEHIANRIQVTLVSKNNHALIHNNRLCLQFNQCHGDIQAFTQLYWSYIRNSPRLIDKINRYRVQMAQHHDNEAIQPDYMIDWSNK
jgi:hypothetical protein